MAGLDRNTLISKFWRRRHVAHSPNDVVLRIEPFVNITELDTQKQRRSKSC